MSYLVLENGLPGFKQAVVSFWFIAPKASIEAVAKLPSTGRPSGRILPLLTFGRSFEGYTVNTDARPESSYTKSYWNYSPTLGYTKIGDDEVHSYSPGPASSRGGPAPQDTSYIGIYCSIDPDTGELIAELRVRLQMAEQGDGTWAYRSLTWDISDHSVLVTGNTLAPATDTAWDYTTNSCRTDGVVPGGQKLTTYSEQDDSDLMCAQYGPDVFEAGAGITIAPDEWHHLLLSFDLEHNPKAEGGTVYDDYGECTVPPDRTENKLNKIDDPCKMWLALDDENYINDTVNFPLRPASYAFPIDGMGANDIATNNHYFTANASNGGQTQQSWEMLGLVSYVDIPAGSMPTYIYRQGDMPSDAPLGIPSVPDKFSHDRHHVQLAELQIFTDVTLDTDSEDNRRAFIDFTPNETGDGGTLSPADPSVAEAFLDQRPAILLHGSDDWINGNNTGYLGIDDDGEIIPEGQFIATGEIAEYSPDPSIEV